MIAPKRYMQGKRVRYEPCDREWLYDQYWTQGKSIHQITREFGPGAPSIQKWLARLGIRVRNRAERSARHSLRMAGENNPAYTNGHNMRYQHRRAIGLHGNRCQWCGWEKGVQVHHVDHVRTNTSADNLMVLCQNCNTVEAHLWALRQKGRATVTWEDGAMIVRFPKE